MPQITLDVVSLDSAPPTVALSGRFDGSGGTIGRDEGNTLVLQDKHRRVSRLHAAVSFPSGVPTLTNASSSLPINIGNVEIDCGHTAPLSNGDLLEIGPYVLRVKLAESYEPRDKRDAFSDRNPGAAYAPQALMQEPIADPPSIVAASPVAWEMPATAPPANNPYEENGDPFASLLSGIGARSPTASEASFDFAPINASKSASDYRSSESFGVSADPLAALGIGGDASASPYGTTPTAAARGTTAVIPEEFNPFDLPSETSRNCADPLSSLLGASTSAGSNAPLAVNLEPSIDSLFAASGSPTLDGLPGGHHGAPALMPGPNLLNVAPDNNDVLAMFGGSSPVSEGSLRPMRDDVAEIGSAYRPPRALESGYSETPSARYPAPTTPFPADVLTEAFLRGANIPKSAMPTGLTPEIMEVVGSLLRSATVGAVDLLAARKETKREFQVESTMIAQQDNNPLKFFPNTDAALKLLLDKRMPGFMRADEAMKDAFADLRAHEIGVITGTRAALSEVLGKFDPSALSLRLTVPSLLENILPAARKKKLWDIYLTRYKEIRREAEDDFQSIFGSAFAKAYEQETRRLKSQSDASRNVP
jgi:FHA domain-containing protein